MIEKRILLEDSVMVIRLPGWKTRRFSSRVAWDRYPGPMLHWRLSIPGAGVPDPNHTEAFRCHNPGIRYLPEGFIVPSNAKLRNEPNFHRGGMRSRKPNSRLGNQDPDTGLFVTNPISRASIQLRTRYAINHPSHGLNELCGSIPCFRSEIPSSKKMSEEVRLSVNTSRKED